MDDRQQRDVAPRLIGFGAASAERLELASAGAVNDVPPGVAQPEADRVGLDEVTRPTSLDALVEEALSLSPIQQTCALRAPG